MTNREHEILLFEQGRATDLLCSDSRPIICHSLASVTGKSAFVVKNGMLFVTMLEPKVVRKYERVVLKNELGENEDYFNLIFVKYTDLNGKICHRFFFGELARVIQAELS